MKNIRKMNYDSGALKKLSVRKSLMYFKNIYIKVYARRIYNLW